MNSAGQQPDDAPPAGQRDTATVEQIVDIVQKPPPAGFVAPRVTRGEGIDSGSGSDCHTKSGTYLFLMFVGQDGKLREARPVVSDGMNVDPCVTRSVLHYEFEPARLHGKPVASRFIMHAEVQMKKK